MKDVTISQLKQANGRLRDGIRQLISDYMEETGQTPEVEVRYNAVIGGKPSPIIDVTVLVRNW